jgi:hypothetical protein
MAPFLTEPANAQHAVEANAVAPAIAASVVARYDFNLYSIPAHHERAIEEEGVPVAEYPVAGSSIHSKAARRAKLAKAAGMKYIAITTKHHEGFASSTPSLRIIALLNRRPAAIWRPIMCRLRG